MHRAPSVAELFDRLAERLALRPVHLDRTHARRLPIEPPTDGFPTLIGHLNLVQPNRIQILGPAEIEWWTTRDPADRHALRDRLFRDDLSAIIVTDDEPVPEDLTSRARSTNTPLLQSTSSCERVISMLRHVLGRELAARTVLHGVFMDVLGTGVLLTGDPAVGKSELALELVSRGHSLVADDAPEFSRPAPDAIEGEATAMLMDFLEVRGLGVLNVRAMYGDAAVRHRKRLQLVIHLELLTDSLRTQFDRINGNFGETEILGLEIPSMTLPVAPGRNLAVLVEAAVRNFLLARRGYHAAEDLMQRQEAETRRTESCD